MLRASWLRTDPPPGSALSPEKVWIGRVRIDDGTWAEISKSVELAGFDLRTTTMATGHGRDQAGFTGSATLRLGKKATPAARSAFSTLARFAEFCGTGAQTTQGFGATRLASQEW